jgi:hypothetical protein
MADNQRFKDEITRRFHDYFYQKIKEKKLVADEFYKNFNVSDVSKYSFFSGMRSGVKGITAEQVQIAWEVYGVRPDYLFGIVNQPVNVLAEPPAAYARGAKKDLDKIRALLDQLEKKIENG